MKFLKMALVAASLTGFAATAQAQDSGIYGNLGVEAVEFDSYNVTARLGYEINEYFSVEGQGSLGVIDDEFEGVDVGIDSSFAAFVRGSLPMSEQLSVFAKGGYHFTQIGVDGDGFDDSFDVDGFAYGGGLEYKLNDVSGVRVDVTYLESDDGINEGNSSGTVDTYSIAYVRKF